ncbi:MULTISPECIES: hydrogenase maturation protease [Aminobacterium]|jgi:hydrogenase maturation protease|uniref:hydrogenase maturation protease n=1 Tax=Aminobacterium TaxID=81466 RepID=UPI000467E7C0|nr:MULTISPECIES: hydrogenase maturation protease [Aminobacterium]
MKVFIAGFGNPYREDDSVGLYVAPLVASWLEEQGVSVSIWSGQQLLPELVYDLEDMDVVVFVDADARQFPEGYALEELDANPLLEGLNIHSMGPAWLLSLMERLGMVKPKTLLLSISGFSFNFSEIITSQCMDGAKKAEEAFRKWWKEFISLQEGE